MQSSKRHSIRLTGTLTVDRPVDEAFPLFSPIGEKAWVPDWTPELIHPADRDWAEGQIFCTPLDSGRAVWVVNRLDAVSHRVSYHRVEPEHLVARIDVECRPAGTGRTDVTTSYEFISLSESGDATIAGMTQEAYEAKMKQWEEWIGNAA